MRLMSEKLGNLEALYVRHLRMLLSAEELIAIKTPFLAESTRDSETREVLQRYALDSREQAGQIRTILDRSSSDNTPLKCKAVYALFDESEELVEDASHDDICNSVVIGAAQRIKHYEIAVYEATAQYARLLGRAEDAGILTSISEEERREDKQLCTIAARINGETVQAA